MKNIVAAVQVRMGSSRLPGKVMAEIEGRPMTWHIVNRLRQAKLLQNVVIAVPDNELNEPVRRMAEDESIPYFAGSEADVIGRLYKTACAFDADVLVRICGDCPLVDPDIVDKVVQKYIDGCCQHIGNTRPPTFPDGLDVGLFSFQLLRRLNDILETEIDREWYMLYIWENMDTIRIDNVTREEDISHLRWTVDYPEDLEFVQEVYAELGGDFRTADVLALLERRPELVILDEPRYRRGQMNVYLEGELTH